MAQVIDRVVLEKDGHTKVIAIIYYPEYDTKKHGTDPRRERLGSHLLANYEPYKAVKYVDGQLQDEWEYEYEGRAGNRLFSEVGRLALGNWRIVGVSENIKNVE